MKHFTQKDYDNYMKVVNRNIKETERRLETLDKTKKVSQLSFEDWIRFQNGELRITQSGGGMETQVSHDMITGSNPVLTT